ncbi:MAG: sigma-54-dependent Fis family transcriptional regulator [Archangium sp.]|nr:sigma-54-dependent Fis family transcriptional regulator [Archangium sp.]
MKRLVRDVKRLADKDVTVTFLGETGTGKDVLARICHAHSGRRRGPFVPINCAAIPESLFESEFFGRERGAFTGATERAKGKVEVASGGTLFLDELGELPLSVQPKLLRFLESRRFSRVGGTAKLEADVRLICASGRSLDQEVKAGRFRADLFFRIQGVTLKVPPLRERSRDILPLARHFIESLARVHRVEPPRLSKRACAALEAWSWPGNVRELRSLMEQLCLLREGARLSVEDLPAQLRTQCTTDVLPLPLDRTLDELVETIVSTVLRAENGNLTRAARRLGVSARTLARRRSRR